METATARLQEIWASKRTDKLVAFALYEDAITSARVEGFCQRLVRELAPAQLVKRAWLCNEIRLPKLRSIAVAEAATADVLLLSLHHCEELAPEIALWLKAVLERDSHPSIVHALFDGTHAGDSSSIRAKLAELTSNAGVELIASLEEMPEDELA